MHLDLQEVKHWLRIDKDESTDDTLIEILISAAKDYLYEATGKSTFGKQTDKAKLLCQFLITDWYENRDYNNRTPMAIRKPVLTSILMQLIYGGDDDEQSKSRSGMEQSSEFKQTSGTLRERYRKQQNG